MTRIAKMVQRAALAGATPSAPFSPLDLGWHVAVWAEDPGWTHPGDGNPVSSWRDATGAGNTLAEASSGLWPTYRTAGINGLPAVEFSQDRLYTDLAAGLAEPYSVVAIARHATVGSSRYIVGWRQANNTNNMGTRSGRYPCFAQGSAVDFGVSPDTAPHLWACVLQAGANDKGIVDGLHTVTGNAGAQPADRLQVGGSANSNNFVGLIAFAALFAGDVTADPLWPAFKTWSERYGLTTF